MNNVTSRNEIELYIEGPTEYGVFLRRPNRFLAICEINRKEIECYLPNPGPMPDLLFPGVEVCVRFAPALHRKTDFDLIGTRHRGVLLSLDSRIPNYLVSEALNINKLEPFNQYGEICAEPVYKRSRLDFILKNTNLPSCLIETKSSTHAENSIAYFPRAITERGQRHLHELMHAIDQGYRAAIIFIVQRTDANKLRPNDRVDPSFGTILREAVAYGVEPYAWTSFFDEERWTISLDHSIPVDLSPSKLT